MIDLIKALTPTQRVVAIGVCIVVLVLVGLGVLGLKERNVTSEVADSLPRTDIPPIDASAPAKTETATFALG